MIAETEDEWALQEAPFMLLADTDLSIEKGSSFAH